MKARYKYYRRRWFGQVFWGNDRVEFNKMLNWYGQVHADEEGHMNVWIENSRNKNKKAAEIPLEWSSA